MVLLALTVMAWIFNHHTLLLLRQLYATTKGDIIQPQATQQKVKDFAREISCVTKVSIHEYEIHATGIS